MSLPPQPEICSLGNAEILKRHKTAFLCSRDYPAHAVLRIYDWAKEMRETGECVISGFHSALERDVFGILVRGSQPIILAAARGLPKRYPADVKKAIDDGRLLVVSPFPDSVRRITAGTARKRTAFLLSVAERVVVGYMSRDGALAEGLSRVALHKEVVWLSEG